VSKHDSMKKYWGWGELQLYAILIKQSI